MSKNKIKKGGDSQLDIKRTPIYILTLNILMIVSHFFIFIYLYKNSLKYNVILYLFISLVIVSFFTIIFILWGTYIYLPSSNFPEKNDPVGFARIISYFLLACFGIFQFISTILCVNVINNRVPNDNSFILTVSNALNLLNYEIYYLTTYVAIIVLAVIIITPISKTNINRDKITYYLLLFASITTLVYLSYKTFIHCFSIYSNVVLKKNPLYQGNL